MSLDRRTSPRYYSGCPAKLEIHGAAGKESIRADVIISEIAMQGVTVSPVGCMEIAGDTKKLKLEFSPFGRQGKPVSIPVRYEKKIEKNGETRHVLVYRTLDEDNIKSLMSYMETLEPVPERRKISERRKEAGPEFKGKRKLADRRLKKPVFLKCTRYNRMAKIMERREYFYLREMQSRSDRMVRHKGKELLMFGSNNYLGLASHPEVKEAAIKTVEKYGVGTGSVRVLCGTLDLHNELEKKLAEFKGGEDCVIFTSGYGTNVGVLSIILSSADNVFFDAKSHASIIDGCKLSEANMILFKHNDMEDLENKLKKSAASVPRLIVTDGVFSMDGDVAMLDVIYDLAQKYNAAVLIDDAHSTGVIGKTGRGTSEKFGLEGKIDIVIGTLSKALGGVGGFAIANRKIVHFLKHASRAFVFSTSLPACISAALLKSVELIQTRPEIHRNLWRNIDYLKSELLSLGYDLTNTESAILPVIIGDDDKTYQVTKALEEEGILVSPVVYPAVRRKEARIRASVMATHTMEDLGYFIEKMKKIGKKEGII